MKNIDRWWVMTGVVFLLAGMGLGLKMAVTFDYSMHSLHAHLNLLGFVLMTLFGLCYRNWPRMRESVLARVHYFMHAVPVAVALSMFFFLLQDPENLGPKLGPIMDSLLMVTYVGVILFAYLFFTRAED